VLDLGVDGVGVVRYCHDLYLLLASPLDRRA
jgi:hypothetical protein